MKTKEKPVNKPSFDRWSERITKPSFMHAIPAILAMECECLVVAYHGSYIKAAWHIFTHGIIMTIHSRYWGFVYFLAGRWTQKRHIPGTKHWIRHARSCDKLNCENVDCCARDIPQWFKRLSGMAKYEDLPGE